LILMECLLGFTCARTIIGSFGLYWLENEVEQLQPELNTETPEEKQSARQFFLDVFETVVISLLLFLAINVVSARIRVDGHSMVPTFMNGEFVIVDKISYRFSSPSRGDVVVFHYPRDPQQEYIKRIIGLPGDHVAVGGGVVYVNGQALDEPYIADPPNYTMEMDIPQGQYFVLGDNRNNSSDSHNWGTVPANFLIGKAVFVYWPLTEAGVVKTANAANPPASP
jgi:signal peptidase I